MSKNFNLLYVFIALLLLFFMATSEAATKTTAVKQRIELIKRNGLIEATIFKQRCQKITNQLKITNQCLLLNSDDINAFAFSDGVIMITWGLLKRTHNPDQLAHIISHESSHIILKHHQHLANFINKPPVFFPKTKLKKLRQSQEIEADQIATKQLKRYGFDTAQIHHLWQQLLNTETENKWADHQSLNQRIESNMLKIPLDNDSLWQTMIHDLSQR
ncbi:M48 family metallopeptidase [Marinicella rhabdoformis]|uniref:M48 family metallopeptidase n=1 Tax=Marinicella rhabdoformis TaxID=2580566 RepID=UPI0012AECF9E|nr:M48 family metallopeptidase [Marinicella rhabdoformis]